MNQTASSQTDRLKGPTILLAEDDHVWSYLAGRFLEKNGFKVLYARDGRQALELYDRHHETIDAVLADVLMPHIDGVQLAKINFSRFNLPFVICTNTSDPMMALNVLDYGVQDYVVKPSGEKQLVSVINYALARSRLMDKTAPQDAFAGNLDKITIKPLLDNIRHAEAWLYSRISPLITDYSDKHFKSFIFEFLINAYEHGCLKIYEQEKADLIDNGEYEAELARREKLGEKGEIEIRIAILGRKVTITIADSGSGFDYGKYQHMKLEDVTSRLTMPNGRGIMLASRHCDEVHYDRNGSRVTLVKTFP